LFKTDMVMMIRTIEDRRVQKTRKALHEALISLMMQKKYEWIAVQDILDRANVGRSTFYFHYHDKDELLLDGLNNLWDMLRQEQTAARSKTRKEEAVIGFSLAWFRHTYGHKDVFKLMVGSKAWEIVRARMEEMLIQLIKDQARPLYKKRSSSGNSFELFAYFLGSGFLSVMTWWLSQKNPATPEQIDSVFRELTLPIVYAHLG
jgi:AcrR family transcriptional regulator